MTGTPVRSTTWPESPCLHLPKPPIMVQSPWVWRRGATEGGAMHFYAVWLRPGRVAAKDGTIEELFTRSTHSKIDPIYQNSVPGRTLFVAPGTTRAQFSQSRVIGSASIRFVISYRSLPPGPVPNRVREFSDADHCKTAQ